MKLRITKNESVAVVDMPKAVKVVWEATGFRLKEANDAVVSIVEGNPFVLIKDTCPSGYSLHYIKRMLEDYGLFVCQLEESTEVRVARTDIMHAIEQLVKVNETEKAEALLKFFNQHMK